MTRPHAPLFDPGLQLERTALAWRRTSLSIALGGVVLARISVDVLGRLGLALSSVCLLLAVVSGVAAARRYALSSSRLQEAGPPVGAGWLALGVSLSVAGLAALELVLGVTRLLSL